MSTIFNNNTVFIPKFLSNTYIDAFMAALNDLNWDTSMRSRKTASVGKSYNYNQMTYPDSTIPNIFDSVLNWVTNTLGWTPNNLLCNWYADGTSKMGWHSDDMSILTPNTGVVIISLGFARDISFRRVTDKSNIFNINLVSGSLFYMNDVIQSNYQHSILPCDGATDRVSLTFRSIA
jgi:alkylated DNA repair dioxygenase AlkB